MRVCDVALGRALVTSQVFLTSITQRESVSAAPHTTDSARNSVLKRQTFLLGLG